MKLRKVIVDRGYIVFTVVALLLAIVEFQYDLILSDLVVKYLLIAVYYAFALLGMYSFYKTKKPNKWILLILVLSGISFSTNILLVLPYLLIIPVVYKSIESTSFKSFSYLLLFIMFTGMFLGAMINNLSEVPDERSYTYSDELSCLVEFHNNGDNYSVFIEREYYEIFTLRERILMIEEYEQLSWIDSETIKIDNRTIRINE